MIVAGGVDCAAAGAVGAGGAGAAVGGGAARSPPWCFAASRGYY